MIIDLQRRLREIGRLRIGEQVATQNGKSRPSKLETFRFTSRDRQVIDAAAARWGGGVEPWADAPDGGQWQVTTDTAELTVVVPPSDMSFSQWYELWSAGGCQRRCDGQHDHISEGPCRCDPEARECAIHTRLSVMLPDLPGFGLWRLDTSGYYAASELAGLVELCQRYAGKGTMLPARLRLEQRSVKRIDNGKVITRRFAVPVLDVDVHPLALTGGVAVGELAQPVVPALQSGNLTPVPPTPEALGAPSFAEQVAVVDEPTRRLPRANAVLPVPPTGLRPRTARDAADDLPDDAPPAFQEPSEGVDDPAPTGDSTPKPAERSSAVSVSDVARYATTVFKAAYDAAPRGDKTKVVDRLRHAMAYAVSGGRTTSFKELEPLELVKVHQRLRNIADGEMAYATDDQGVTFVLIANGRETSIQWAQLDANEAA